ncbi:MAG: DoxX-like family protein [Ectothiorhodospiraceae bacterium]|nr:DoxX-like family protein [Ectothiorhodospiraceae bacterium]
MINKLAAINNMGRYALSFVFFYHGLIPKIIVLSQTEIDIVTAHNINIPAPIFSFAAGIIEILLAITIVWFKKSVLPLYISGIMLVALLLDVAIVMPEVLVQAFNPVSTNIAALALYYLIIVSQPSTNKPIGGGSTSPSIT